MKCKVEGCEGKYKTKGYCAKHYQQIRIGGKIFERTIFDKNEYTTCGDITFGHVLTKKHSKVFIIDTEDLPRVQEHKWYILEHRGGYLRVVASKYKDITTRIMPPRGMKLSRFLLNVTDPTTFVDHINHNTLDNRKSNLRVCTNAENSRNQILSSNNTSGYKGVTKAGNRWVAKISFNGKLIHLGTYNTPEEAAQAYDIAAKALHKDFALLNKDILSNKFNAGN